MGDEADRRIRGERVYPSEREMLAGATDLEPLGGNDGKSGASLRRLRIDGIPLVVKRTTLGQDWTMRVTRDSVFRPFIVWRRGIMAQAPACIDHATVAMAFEPSAPGGAQLSILMHDVSASVVPEGDAVVPLDQHLGFVDHMAALAARFWSFSDDDDLTPLADRVRFFSLANVAAEKARDDHSRVIDIADEGWSTLPDAAPRLAHVVLPFHADPGPLVERLASTPQTFVHGDWKMGNLGSHPDGRTILLDWAYPGRAPAALELAWYLALNAARLPQSKEDAIDAYRTALERHGVATDEWWERQLGLSLIAIMAMFGWEKAVGGRDELGWWEDRILREQRWLE